MPIKLTETTLKVIDDLKDYKGPRFIVNELASDVGTTWRKARTAVDKMVVLGLLVPEKAAGSSFTFYKKVNNYKTQVKQLKRQGLLPKK